MTLSSRILRALARGEATAPDLARDLGVRVAVVYGALGRLARRLLAAREVIVWRITALGIDELALDLAQEIEQRREGESVGRILLSLAWRLREPRAKLEDVQHALRWVAS